MTSLRLFAVLNGQCEYACARRFFVCHRKRRAPRTARPLMHFASPPDEICGLAHFSLAKPLRQMVRHSP